MASDYSIANASDEWAKAKKELEKRSRARLTEALSAALTETAKEEAKQVGESFRASILDATPSGFEPAQISDPIVTVNLRNSKGGGRGTARLTEAGRGEHDYRRWNQGVLSHPLFGDKTKWASTAVGAWKGVWQKATKPLGPELKSKVAAAMDRWFQNPSI